MSIVIAIMANMISQMAETLQNDPSDLDIASSIEQQQYLPTLVGAS